MSDTAPLSVLPVVSSSEINDAAGLKTRSAGAQAENKGSFLDFLNAFNGLSSASNSVQDTLLNSGSTLPLSTETAEAGHMSLPVVAMTQTQATDAGSQLQMPVLSTQIQATADETGLAENIHASPVIAAAVDDLLAKPDLSSRVSSAALASRLAGLAQAGNLSAQGASVSAVPQTLPPVLPLTDTQIATSLHVNSDIESLAAALPLQVTNQGKVAPVTLPVDKELSSRPGSMVFSKTALTAAANGGHEVNTSSPEPAKQPVKLDISEANAFFSDQVKKMVAEQQQAMNPDKQMVQAALTSTTANAATTQPVSAAQLGIQTTLPMLTTETVTATVQQATISEQFGRSEWNQGMGKQVLWMANQNIRSAELRLNPAHLGPIEVRIDMEDDQVNLAFSSRHAAVREAVEQAMPRLREMFEENGLKLADTDVSQQSFAEQRNQEEMDYSSHQAAGFSNQSVTGNSEEPVEAENLRTLDTGLVDYYI